MQESYIDNNTVTNHPLMPACNVGLFIPNAFRLKFVFADGREDISTAKLAAYLLNWHKPKIEIKPDTGEKIFSNKFFGEKFQTSYGFLTKELGLSKATIRRSFVKLEKYGYAKRVFENVCLCGQIYNSRLFVELTEKFKLDFGLDKKFGVVLNNENGSDDRSISTNTPSSSRIGAGVINNELACNHKHEFQQ